MNKYPKWWEHSITVYNKYTDPQTKVIKWYRTNLDGCFWKDTWTKLIIGETVVETNSILCRIPKTDLFKESYEWYALPNDLMHEYFTLSTGDIVVRGHYEDDIDEYTPGSRSSDVLNKHKKLQGCMVINKVSINTGSRGIEHYCVRGI